MHRKFIPPEVLNRQTLAAALHRWLCTLDVDQYITNLSMALSRRYLLIE
jgi:hypothetical protein